MTFPFGKAAATPVGQFPEELQLLVDRLNDRLFDRLQAERSPERRALIAGFPTQIATLAQPLQGFLSEAFGGSRLDPAPLLRGVYFASGTQEGTPIDRLTGVMMRAFGLDQRRAAALRPEQGRSYFLGQLVARVIFGEAMLVSEPPTARMRRLILRSASYAVVALLTLGVAGWLVANRSSSQREITEMAAALDTYEKIAKETTFDPVNDADLPRLLPLLDAARELSTTAKASSPLLAGFDLSQTAKLRGGAEGVYRHALGYALLPRLIWRLEAQMRGYFTQPEFLYEATRVYLMLGGQGPLDKSLVKEWMTYDWQHAIFRSRQSGGGRQPSGASGCAPRTVLASGAARRGVGGEGAHDLQPRLAGVPRLLPHQAVGRRPEPAALAAERRDRTGGRKRLHEGFGQETERWHTGLPDRRRVPQGSAAGLGHGDARSGRGKLGAGPESARQFRPLQAKRGRQ